MKPIQEITLFESATEVEDISTLIRSEDSIEVTIPMSGMLVNDRIKVTDTSSNQVIARAGNIGNFCSGSETIPVFLRLHDEQTIVVSRTVKILIHNDEVHLSDFHVLKQEWRERSEQRVQPKFPVYFSFTSDGIDIRASLHDISVKGMCVIANVQMDEIPETITNSDLDLTINVKPYLEEFLVRGIVKDMRYLTESLTRIGLEIFPTRSDFRRLADYIHVRRQEISEEVFANFRAMLNYRQAADLRF
jgi:hypothetical protein